MIKNKALFRTEHPLRDQSIAVNARKSMFNKSQIDHANEIDTKYERLNVATEGFNTGVENRLRRSTFERQIKVATDKIFKDCKTAVFKNIFCDLVVESLIMDEKAVKENEPAIRSVIEAYIDEEGGYEFLLNALKENNIPLLEFIKEAAEETAKKVTNRKRKEIESAGEDCDPNLIDFTLSDEEKKELDYKKSSMALPEVSELVKNKVLTVVKDEKQRAKEQKELQEAIEQEVADEAGEEATTESFTAIMESRVIDKPAREESTIYDSIFRNTFKSVLMEKSATIIDETNPDQYVESQQDLINGMLYSIPEDDLELDLILAESVLQYTIMECAYTIGLTNYTRRDLQKLSQALLN